MSPQKRAICPGTGPGSVMHLELVAARGGARLATEATAQLCRHRVARHAAVPSFLSPTRTISAAEPVASVRAMDIGVTVFMLGTPMSLA